MIIYDIKELIVFWFKVTERITGKRKRRGRNNLVSVSHRIDDPCSSKLAFGIKVSY